MAKREPLSSDILPPYLRRDTGDLWSSHNENKNNYQLWQEQKEFAWAQMLEANRFTSSEREAAQVFARSEREAAQQFDLEMWNRTNEYNSPEAQAARLRAAGLNPMNVLDGVDEAGTIQSSPASSSGGSGATPSPGTPPPMRDQLLETMQSADALATTLGKFAQARGFMIDNETRSAQNKAELDKLVAEKENLLKSSQLSEQQRERLKHEIVGLKIANLRADFAAKHDAVWEDRAVKNFQAQMRSFQDQHETSALNSAVQKLQMQLAKNSDAREQKLIAKQIQVFQAQIEKAAHENHLIDAQKLKTQFEKDLIGVQHRRAQTDEERENSEHERYTDSVNGVRSTIVGRLIDDVLYYTASSLGVPLRGMFK